MSSSSFFVRGNGLLCIRGSMDPTTMDERSLNHWWTNEHLPERLAIPGFLRTRRYYTTDHTKRSYYLVCYEVSSLDVLTSDAYMSALDNPTPGTAKYMPVMAASARSACNVLFSTGREEFKDSKGGGVGGTIVLICVQVPESEEKRQQLRDWITQTTWAKLAENPSSLALHLLEHNDKATNAGNSTSSYIGVNVPKSAQESGQHGKWIILVEFSEPKDAPFGVAGTIQDKMVEDLKKSDVQVLESRLYGLLCMMSE